MSDEFVQNGSVGDVVVDQNESAKSKGVAAVLCFFLGWLGIHRFYAGKVGTGILMIVLNISAWIGVLAGSLIFMPFIGFVPEAILVLWIIIDFIMILCGNFKDGNGKPIK